MHKNILVYCVIVFIALLTFINIFNNDFVNYDDQNYIIENQRIKGDRIIDAFVLFNPAPFLKGLVPKKLNEYLPVRDLTYWFDYQLWEMNPFGYHLTNLIIYILLCIAIFILLKKLIRNQIVALFAVILYTAHPLHTEDVAWVSARKDILSALFYILSFSTYINFSTANDKKLRIMWYTLSFSTFTAGWLSKPLVIILPAILVLYGIFERKNFKKIIFETLLFWGFNIFLFLINTIIVQGVTPLLKGPHPGLFSGINYIGYYLFLFFFPHNLTPIRETLYTFTLFNFIISIFLIIFLFLFTLRNKNLLFALFFFLLNLLPTLNLTVFANYSVHDRYMLIPSAGLCTLIAFIIYEIKKENLRNLIILVLSAIMLFFTTMQNTKWKNSETLWKHTLKFYPESSIAHLNLGSAYSDNHENEKAEIEFWTVINLPEPVSEMRSYAYYNLGMLKLKSGNLDESLSFLESAFKDFPEPAQIHRVMGGIYVKLREPEKAIEHYEMSLTLDPGQMDKELIEAIIMRLKSTTPPLPQGQP